MKLTKSQATTQWVFITDFGEVKAGPKVACYISQQLDYDLRASTKTKRYKRARAQMDRLEAAVAVMAEVYWLNDCELDRTP